MINIFHLKATLSNMSRVRRLHYQGIIWRFRFLMMATLVTAALTVIGFIIGQVSEGQYKWDEDISLEYTSGFMTGTIFFIKLFTCLKIKIHISIHDLYDICF